MERCLKPTCLSKIPPRLIMRARKRSSRRSRANPSATTRAQCRRRRRRLYRHVAAPFLPPPFARRLLPLPVPARKGTHEEGRERIWLVYKRFKAREKLPYARVCPARVFTMLGMGGGSGVRNVACSSQPRREETIEKSSKKQKWENR